jgi:hypothetical protein
MAKRALYNKPGLWYRSRYERLFELCKESEMAVQLLRATGRTYGCWARNGFSSTSWNIHFVPSMGDLECRRI